MAPSPAVPTKRQPAGRPMADRLTRDRRAVLVALVVIRLVNAWSIATFFQPDEFFQALEPAWDLAFGTATRPWLTWEWNHQLRSSLHPALFALAYLVAETLSSWLPISLTSRTAIIMAAPKLLQAIFAALGDWYTWQLAVTIYGRESTASLSVLLLQIFSPWQWYVSTRTFSNSFETTLTAMALYYWQWKLLAPAVRAKENTKPRPDILGPRSRRRAALCLAALAVVLRPTNVLIWATIIAMTLTRLTLSGPSPLTRSSILALGGDAVLCGGAVLAISLVSDRLYFGSWTFPPLHWLRFNISHSLAVFYGRNPWHYYLVQALPLLCTTSLPFALHGLVSPTPSASTPIDRPDMLRPLSATVFVTIAVLSLVSHKEVRFVYPSSPPSTSSPPHEQPPSSPPSRHPLPVVGSVTGLTSSPASASTSVWPATSVSSTSQPPWPSWLTSATSTSASTP
ncbi:GPI mannosyltransferase 3 [Ophiocordyceps camponoti-floridani]|uniref:Mannosyltransferase n=1 Tax=Ophiocordyceps camponoti-floridani TaxID=2030778 RepID=A0A8H4QDU1_9HYPO|nr:GPI mannosyltransferase 3 [Ophiocordyceps camponoti-floridani]